MKRNKLMLVAVYALCSSMFLSSCVGPFSLFNKLSSWNQNLNGNKFVNELVYLALNIIPVYSICYTADALVINSIQFWTGKNPIANVGDVKQVKGENGNYLVETLENGYNIAKEGEDSAMQLIYNSEDNTWNVQADGESHKLLQMNGDDTATLFLQNGKSAVISLDANGMVAAHQLVENTMFAMN